MSGQFIIHAIKDIIPHQPEPYPQELIDYANALYSHSKLKQVVLSNQYEVARHHLAAYLAVEKFEKTLELNEPITDKIPIPRRHIRSTIVTFKNGLLNNPSSNQGTPSKTLLSTPRKRKLASQNQLLTPVSSSKSRIVKVGYDIKKDDHDDEDDDDDDDDNVEEEEFDDDDDFQFDDDDDDEYGSSSKKRKGKSTKGNNGLMTPESTPRTKRQQQQYTPKKSKQTQRPKSSVKDKLLAVSKEQDEEDISFDKNRGDISSTLLVSFVNKFYIPAEVTENIIKTYNEYRARIRNSWGLLCGLVSLVYFKINKKEIEYQLGHKTKFLNNLHMLQSGGLSMIEIIYFNKLIKNILSSEKWVLDLDLIYNDEIEIPLGINGLGSMITPDVCYTSEKLNKDFIKWGDMVVTKLRIN